MARSPTLPFSPLRTQRPSSPISAPSSASRWEKSLVTHSHVFRGKIEVRPLAGGKALLTSNDKTARWLTTRAAKRSN